MLIAVSAGLVAPLEAVPEPARLLESATALEQSAVKLHKAYSGWLRETGQFPKRSEDGLYTDLCMFRNSCRAVACQVRADAVPQVYENQLDDIWGSLGALGRYREYKGLDPAVRELMRHACSLASSFRGAYHAFVFPERDGADSAASAAARPQNPARVGPLRLLPNRFDIMSYLENRWACHSH